MPRYIDADDFKREMEKYLPDDRELALKVLKKVPTIDAVEVVRCKKCKFAKRVDLPFPMDMLLLCLKTGFPSGDGEFCSWGERRSE